MNRLLTASAIKKALVGVADPEKAAFFPRFFKAGPGEYAEGDQFMGVTVPAQRIIAKQFRGLPQDQLDILLADPIHECRLTAILIVVDHFQRSRQRSDKKACLDYLLSRTQFINNWDLVDSCAYQVVGTYLCQESDRSVLDRLAASSNLWEQRMAVVANKALIKQHEFAPLLKLAKKLLKHKHDLIHKAVGWMLREVGEQDSDELLRFLDKHAPQMPRTMLRYAIEKLPKPQRRAYLDMR
jgi:3-methyladenine DNA glycosylase AlkD